VLGRSGTNWYVRQRIMSGGLDRPLVTRLVPSAGAAARNMAFIADRQGTTLAAVNPSGLRDETAAYFGRNVFGQLEGASGTGSSSNPETGFTGASTPNQTGGFTYLRNRWYDPQSGRFLTQDPIGLAGGVNLYAYAGNNPVSYADPFGLDPCKSSSAWTECLAQGVANWGASQGGVAGAVALNAGAALNAAMEATGVNAAASTGDAIGSGRLVEGGVGLAMMMLPLRGNRAAGNVARTESRSLAEQLTMAEAKGGAGSEIMAGKVKDARYPAESWAKMQHTHQHADGSQSVIHYWKDRVSGAMEGFKFKD
jgi:RHS repeat-associated protein